MLMKKIGKNKAISWNETTLEASRRIIVQEYRDLVWENKAEEKKIHKRKKKEGNRYGKEIAWN